MTDMIEKYAWLLFSMYIVIDMNASVYWWFDRWFDWWSRGFFWWSRGFFWWRFVEQLFRCGCLLSFWCWCEGFCFQCWKDI